MKNLLLPIFIVSAITLAVFSCSKYESGTSQLTIKMKDAPGDFQQVNVEILEIQVHNSSTGWSTLPTNQGIYDLLTLQDSVTAVLVNSGAFPSGQTSQLRMILGENNTVMVDSVIYDLKTPSAQQSGLKINVKTDFLPNETYEILLDFDAEKSVVKQGNGKFNLKPVLKLESVNQL